MIKRIITGIIALPMIFGTTIKAQSQEHHGVRTIVTPRAEEARSQYQMVRSIDLCDTATIIRYSFLHRPDYWCSLNGMELVGNQSGKTYKLIKTDGYTIGEKKYMPASGRFDFDIYFPAIDTVDTSVDMVEVLEGGHKLLTNKNINLTGKVESKYQTHLSGTYEGNAGYLGIMKSDAERNHSMIWIPIENGKFEYIFPSDELLAYEIINGPNLFFGAWSSNIFFSENAAIEINFKQKKDGNSTSTVEYHDITINAPEGTLTESYARLRAALSEHYYTAPAVVYRDSIEKAEKYYIPEYYALTRQIKEQPESRDSLVNEFYTTLGDNPLRTAEGERAEAAVIEYAQNDRIKFLCEKAVEMDNLAGLYAIVNDAYYNDNTAQFIEAYLKGYQGKYPESEYAMYMEKLSGSNEIVPGSQFNDFSAKDADGNIHTLSKLIKGKPALLDLWASWCGPCRRTSKSMIPVYDEYASKGFTIIGVAREFGDKDTAVKAIENDGYKWLNLFEIDDENGIWALYRRQNAAGGTFLISPEGKIVKSDVTADDVRNYLKTLYPEE